MRVPLSDQLNLPLPAPGQLHEPLGPGRETDTLKDSEKLAMQQKMMMADFEKSLAQLIGKQRNPNVPNMTLNDAVQIALKQNPDILNAIQQIRITRGQLIQVASQAVPKIVNQLPISKPGRSIDNQWTARQPRPTHR